MNETNNATLTKPAPQQAPATRNDFSADQVDLIRRLICPKASDDELALFLHQCRKTGLDPLARQIHAIMRQEQDDSGNWVPKLSIQTGIDGYWLVADRTGLCAGNDDTVFGPEFEVQPKVFAPVWAKATVFKLVAGKAQPYTATVRFSEFAGRKRNGELTKMWREKPYMMLGKCAEAAALRKGFPQELSGVYTREEMPEQEVPEITPSPVRLPAAPVKPLAAPLVTPKPEPMTQAQADRIDALCEAIGIKPDVFERRIHKDFGHLSSASMTCEQAAQVVARLEHVEARARATEAAPA